MYGYTTPRWTKSTRSNPGGNCVEVGIWKKPKRSTSNGGNCVEVMETRHLPAIAAFAHKADADVLYLMRDSKDPEGPQLAFTTSEWEAFIGGVKDGEFDVPPENAPTT